MALVIMQPERALRRARLTRVERFGMIGMEASPEKLPLLARFIRYLEAGGLVEFGPPLAAGEEGLAVVDRVQQYAFVALYYGLDMEFDFDVYSACGPASSELANAVYRLSNEDSGVYGTAEPSLPGSFRGSEFLEMVDGKGKAWMNAATTMLDKNIDHKGRPDGIRDTVLLGQRFDPAVVDDAFGELGKRGMLPAEGQ